MNKTAIITGASRGIGKACAIHLADHFDTIVINSFQHTDDLSAVADAIRARNTEVLVYSGDIGDYDFVGEMMRDILGQGLTVDLLINNAGISHVGLLSDMTISDWNRIVATNLTSVFNCCNRLVPHMVSNRSGHIINISSMWGISGASCEVAYSTTKGGIHAFTQALAKELAPSNVRVNAIACGAVDTQMNACFSAEEMRKLCDDIPVGRLGSADEVAELVLQLYQSPAYLTGDIIKMDGGYL